MKKGFSDTVTILVMMPTKVKFQSRYKVRSLFILKGTFRTKFVTKERREFRHKKDCLTKQNHMRVVEVEILKRNMSITKVYFHIWKVQ